MRLDIDDNSLHDFLQSKKNDIGGSWINGLVNIVAGISFVIAIYSAKFSMFWINFCLYIIAILLVVIGGVETWKNIGKKSYSYEKLYDDIKKLSIIESQYSLVAILNDFEGDYANKVLLQYFQGGWKTFMFLSYRSASENDESNVKARVAANLKIARNQLTVKFLTEVPYQPKYSPDHKSVRMYHNKYYQVFINEFSETLKQPEFIIDGIKYKWMTLEEMWNDKQINKNNADVLRVFEKYIFNTKKQSVDTSFIVPKNVYIRLNRVCNLSCSFCLAEKISPGLSKEQLKTILKILKLNGVEKAKLTGGEPTLRPDLFEIIEYSIELGMDTVIYSNLYISEEIINKLIQYPISVSTSIHGDEKFHDEITKKGAYKKTYANVLRLTSAHIPVSLHMVVMSKNFSLAEKVINDAIRAGVRKVTFQTLIPREKGADLFHNGENADDIQEKMKLLYPLKEKYKSLIQIDFSNLYQKSCCVVETDGSMYLEKEDSGKDIFIRRLI